MNWDQTEGKQTKPAQTRIGDLWCSVMHAEPMWPAHGQYECRTCGRRHRVCWEQPLGAAQRMPVLAPQAQSAFAVAAGR
jgi:hypothetical protein